MKKIAAIDIGTNSMRLLLCEVENSKITKKTKELITTRIGQDVSHSGILSQKAIDRNVEALKYFKNKAFNFGADEVFVIATSALRDASNRDVFVKKALSETGLKIEIIDGQREAELGILGVLSDMSQTYDCVLVIDIGGGSTELILSENNNINFGVSINAGAVRMTERCIYSDPIKDDEINNLENTLDELFCDAISKLSKKQIKKVVAIGGTATTMASIYYGFKEYKPEIVHNSVLDISYLTSTFDKLKNMKISERYFIDGLQKERADVIPCGLYIMIYIMKKLRIENIIISENDNLEGIILSHKNENVNNM